MPEKVFDGGLLSGSPVAIGIDQSLTGFALTALNVHKPEAYETWVYRSPYQGTERLADIREWVISKLKFIEQQNCPITEVSMEDAVLASFAALKLGELAGLVKMTIWDYFPTKDYLRRPLLIPPLTLKKYAAGKGNAKKQEMLLQMFKRWGVEFNDDNAADSYALARLAAGIHTNAVEKAIVEQIKDPKYKD